MLALIFLNVVSRRADLDSVFEAFGAGYRAEKRAEPMMGVDWKELWEMPIPEVRARLALEPSEILGEGILSAAA